MNKRIYPLVCVLLGFALTGWWIIAIMEGKVLLADEWTRKPVEWVAGTPIYSFFRFMTNFGSEFFMYPFTFIMAIILVILYRDWLPGLIFAGGTLSGHLVNKGIKIIVARERPSILAAANAEGFSFPSGHAMITLIAYGLLLYFITKKLRTQKGILIARVILIGMIILIGISRYVINVHYITDILAGYFYGLLLLYALIYLYEKINHLRGRGI